MTGSITIHTPSITADTWKIEENATLNLENLRTIRLTRVDGKGSFCAKDISFHETDTANWEIHLLQAEDVVIQNGERNTCILDD